MKNIFKNIDSVKRDKIINAALEEFSVNSFAKASTNNIVKRAEISKGSLFHYFKSKENLYKHLKIWSVELMVEEIGGRLNWDDPDLFSRIKQVIMIKSEILSRYPDLITFSKNTQKKKITQGLNQTLDSRATDMYNKFYYQNIDYKLFKTGLDADKAIQITQWVMEQFSRECLRSKDFNSNCFSREIDEYLELLKKAFYK